MAIVATRGEGIFLSDMKGIGLIRMGAPGPKKHTGTSMATVLKWGYWEKVTEETPELEAAREYERELCREKGITEKAPW